MRPGRELPSETTEVRVASKENSQLGQMKISCEAGESLPGERDYTQPQNSKDSVWKQRFQNPQTDQGLSTLRDEMAWSDEIPMKTHGMWRRR